MAQLQSTQITGSLDLARSIACEGSAGYIWFDSTIGRIKFTNCTPVSSWSTGGTMTTARSCLAGAGDKAAGLAFGGRTPTISTCTEEYSSGTWTNITPSALRARELHAGAGTQNAAIAFGGSTPTLIGTSDSYNGSSWTTEGDLVTNRNRLAGASTDICALAIGGSTPTTVTCTERYNGMNWFSCSGMVRARSAHAGLGTADSAIAVGGFGECETEEFNGVTNTWSLGPNVYQDVQWAAGFGTSNAATITSCGRSFSYDGVAWRGDVGTGDCLCDHAGAGSTSSGMVFGGNNPALSNTTYEYNQTCTLEVKCR